MRGKPAKKRVIKPDLIHNSVLVTKLIKKMMLDGKRTKSEKIVYTAMENLSKETKQKPVEALEKAISNIAPEVEVRSRRVGGAYYQVPVPVEDDRRTTLALRWLVEATRSLKGQPMADKLTGELINAYKGAGAAVKKKEDTHRMADANKAFSHFAWNRNRDNRPGQGTGPRRT